MTESVLAIGLVLAVCAALGVTFIVLWRARHSAQPHNAAMAELAQRQTDAATRIETMIRMLGDRQSQLQHAVNERLDSVSHRLGDSIQKTTQNTTEKSSKAS